MNDIFAMIGKVLGLCFAATVILYTSLLTWQLAAFAEDGGWSVEWVGRNDIALLKDGDPILQPDALLRFRKDDQERCFLVEYHDEPKWMHAYKKVRQYESAFSTDLWMSCWEMDVFPAVLVVFDESIVG